MFKYIFLFASFLTVFAGKNGLREQNGPLLNVVLVENDEWKHFSNFQEKFNKRYETIHELETLQWELTSFPI